MTTNWSFSALSSASFCFWYAIEPSGCTYAVLKSVTVQACSYSSSSEPDLKETFKKVLPAKRELLKKVKAHGDKKLGDVKVENTLGGMRCANIQRTATRNDR
jgi:hypothetical protein